MVGIKIHLPTLEAHIVCYHVHMSTNQLQTATIVEMGSGDHHLCSLQGQCSLECPSVNKRLNLCSMSATPLALVSLSKMFHGYASFSLSSTHPCFYHSSSFVVWFAEDRNLTNDRTTDRPITVIITSSFIHRIVTFLSESGEELRFTVFTISRLASFSSVSQ